MTKLILLAFFLAACGSTYDKVQGIEGKQGERGQDGMNGQDGKDAPMPPTIPPNPIPDPKPMPKPEPQPTPQPSPQPTPTPPTDDYGYPIPNCPNGKPCYDRNSNTTTVIINGIPQPPQPVPPPQDTIIVCACVPTFGCREPSPCIWTTLRIRAKDEHGYNIGYRGECK